MVHLLIIICEQDKHTSAATTALYKNHWTHFKRMIFNNVTSRERRCTTGYASDRIRPSPSHE